MGLVSFRRCVQVRVAGTSYQEDSQLRLCGAFMFCVGWFG